ncbi:RICIN domain-containing protein [Nonomuraea helvata]|uniref:RICIN domain-containing protein n=1 Tax=Nonomuraea helvata TaxID=37484 RepID=A0ABV5SEN0_9ACTN
MWVNSRSAQCLTVAGGSTANSAPTIQWYCGSGDDQKWSWTGDIEVGARGYLINKKSGKCLADPASSTTEGKQLIIYTCNQNDDQYWILGSGFRLQNDHSRMYMAVAAGSFTAGAKVIQWPATNGDEQDWGVVVTG